MAERFPEMSVTVRLGDLLEANERLARRVREEAEAEMASRERRFGCGLIPRDEVVRMLRVDPSTLWRWENEYGCLRAVRFGRKVYYREDDIESVIRSHTGKI